MRNGIRMRTLRTLLGMTLAIQPLLVGCGGSGTNRPTMSGSTAADERAEMYVDAANRGDDDETGPRTLYQRIGGAAAIEAIVQDMTARVINDPRVNFNRSNVDPGWLSPEYQPWKATPENIERFKRSMVDFLTLAAGGPTHYGGRDMKAAHDGMMISNNEFDAFVGDVKASMDKMGVQLREQRDLLAIIETTRKQIVEEP